MNAAVIKRNFYSTYRHEKRWRQALGCRCQMGIFIQLTAMRKDDAKRPGAAVINGNVCSTHRHEKRRCQTHECRCFKGEILFNSPPWEKTTPSAWVPLSSNRILSASAPVRMSRFFLCKIGLRREEIFGKKNKTCTVSKWVSWQIRIRT